MASVLNLAIQKQWKPSQKVSGGYYGQEDASVPVKLFSPVTDLLGVVFELGCGLGNQDPAMCWACLGSENETTNS